MISEADRAERVRLEEQVDDLKFEIKRLNKLLLPPSTFQPELKLTPLETKILNCILTRSPQIIGRNQLLDALYYDRVDQAPDYNIVAVVVSHIRKKLDPLGITIGRKYGEGLMIDVESATRLRAYQVGSVT